MSFELTDYAVDQLADLAFLKSMIEMMFDTKSSKYTAAEDTADALVSRAERLGTDKVQSALIYSDLAGLLADASSLMVYTSSDMPSYLSVVFSLTAIRLMDAAVVEVQKARSSEENTEKIPEEAPVEESAEDSPEEEDSVTE